MIIACHQGDFLPYVGFWNKMYEADIFDLRIFDKFVKDRYMQRVKMGHFKSWWGVPIKHSMLPINQVEISYEIDWIGKRFDELANWYDINNAEKENIIKQIKQIFNRKYKYLWELNFILILYIKGLLNIKTPVAISNQSELTSTERLIQVCKFYRADTYLSGQGAKEYLDADLWKQSSLELVWHDYKSSDERGILHLLLTKGVKETERLVKNV